VRHAAAPHQLALLEVHALTAHAGGDEHVDGRRAEASHHLRLLLEDDAAATETRNTAHSRDSSSGSGGGHDAPCHVHGRGSRGVRCRQQVEELLQKSVSRQLLVRLALQLSML
jgi:hypothetical protein